MTEEEAHGINTTMAHPMDHPMILLMLPPTRIHFYSPSLGVSRLGYVVGCSMGLCDPWNVNMVSHGVSLGG